MESHVSWFVESHLSGNFCLFGPKFLGKWQESTNDTLSIDEYGLSSYYTDRCNSICLNFLHSMIFCCFVKLIDHFQLIPSDGQ